MRRILPLFFVCLSGVCYSQKPRNVKQEMTWLKNALLQHHVEPQKIDDTFSANLFDKLLDDLDPDRIFFTKSDIAFLESYRTLLDDELEGKSLVFLDRLKDRYRAGLQRSERLINTLLASPLDWKEGEVYEPQPEWPKDELECRDRHQRWLKYQVLGRLAEMMERDSLSADGFFKNNLSDAVAYVKVTAFRPITRLLRDPALFENEMSDAFLQSMASVFDPHSAFFSTGDYDEFVASLSTEDYQFGFMLNADQNGNVVISALSPGGAAWKSGALHVSDVLLQVKCGDEDRIDLRGMHMEDVNEVLSSNRSDVLEMTLRGVDGAEKTVTLKKEKQASEQDVVQSFILGGDIRAGYIYLPDFYTRWDDEKEGGRCANDVATEIVRLKKEGIDGIILDLRFNGGGSLFEASAMAGIFIDEGPLAMIAARDKKVVTIKDMNRGTVYNGPLILLVNSQSASASEVLAASIQDYNRGLIVGSRTYGKATGQNLFPIDGMSVTSPVAKSTTSSVGYVKVTTQKLFRVTGKSAQGTGVIPDVQLPDVFSALNISEDRQPFSLKADSISANRYYKPFKALDREKLQLLSHERLTKNASFQELQETIAWVEKEMSKSEPKVLEWEAYVKAIQEERKKQAEVKGFKSPEKIYEVANIRAKDQRLMLDDYAHELNARWQEILLSDIYLQETYRILRDYISLTKNP